MKIKLKMLLASTDLSSSFTILSSLTLCRLPDWRKRCPLSLKKKKKKKTRRGPRRKLAWGEGMSVDVAMPTPSNQRDKNQGSFLDSTGSKSILMNDDQNMSIVISFFFWYPKINSTCTCRLLSLRFNGYLSW
jgi:hypothetical protein